MTSTDVETTVCPFSVGAAPVGRAGVPVARPTADRWARRILRISDTAPLSSRRDAERAFQRSMLISATRCTLTYVVFPFVLPALGIVTSVGPVLGLAIGLLALVCDVFSVRRFFVAEHRYRWHFTVIAGAVMCLLAVLVVQDVLHLLT